MKIQEQRETRDQISVNRMEFEPATNYAAQTTQDSGCSSSDGGDDDDDHNNNNNNNKTK
jgi:hypothetical protein